MTKGPCVHCGKITGCYFKLPDRTPVHACISCMKKQMIEEAGVTDDPGCGRPLTKG